MARTPTLCRCAIYTRPCSASSDQTLSSCDVRFELCHAFLRARRGAGWRWIRERLDDVGETGADTSRRAFLRLMQLVDAGEVDKVMVFRLDRLARSLLDCLNILKAFRQASVQLHIISAPGLGTSATDSFVLNLMATFAEFERQLIR